MRDFSSNMNALITGHLGISTEGDGDVEKEKGKTKTDNSSEAKETIPLPNYDSSASRMNYLAQWQKKYGKLEGRGDHILKVNEIPRGGSGTARDISIKTAKSYGLDPALLYASSMEEGMSGLFKDKSGLDTKKRKPGEFGYQSFYGDKEYPINGNESFGLPDFAKRFPELVKGGYLKKDFKDRFRGTDRAGEFSENDFKTVDDAMKAKAAIIKYNYDYVSKYVDQENISLSPAAKDFFALVAYNGGEGTAKKMIKDYNDNGLLEGDKFLKNRPTSGKGLKEDSYKKVYENVIRRIKMSNALKKEKLFDNDNT